MDLNRKFKLKKNLGFFPNLLFHFLFPLPWETKPVPSHRNVQCHNSTALVIVKDGSLGCPPLSADGVISRSFGCHPSQWCRLAVGGYKANISSIVGWWYSNRGLLLGLFAPFLFCLVLSSLHSNRICFSLEQSTNHWLSAIIDSPRFKK